MILVDFIAIGAAVLFGSIGAAIGFGKVLKMFAKGLVGIIASVLISYLLFSLVYHLSFVQALLVKFTEFLQSQDNGFTKFLLTIRIDMIVVGVALFVVVRILIRLFAGALAAFFSADVALIKGFNSLLGGLLGLAFFIAIALIAMHLLYMVYGGEGSEVHKFLTGSFFRLDELYINNPFAAVINAIPTPAA